eukprot:4023916-Pyramimonas_sp.AAC.1
MEDGSQVFDPSSEAMEDGSQVFGPSSVMLGGHDSLGGCADVAAPVPESRVDVPLDIQKCNADIQETVEIVTTFSDHVAQYLGTLSSIIEMASKRTTNFTGSFDG